MATNTVETPAKNGVEQEPGTIVVSADGAAAQHNLRNIRLIIGREYKNLATQRGFLISSIILLAWCSSPLLSQRLYSTLLRVPIRKPMSWW